MNWFAVDARLVQHFNFRPWELGRLTLAEVALFSERSAKLPVTGGMGREVSDEELAEQAVEWSTMTPRRKLEFIKQNV